MIKQEAFLRIFRALDNRRGLGAGYVSVTFSGVCFGPGPLARTCTGPVTRVIGSTFLPPPRSTRRSPPETIPPPHPPWHAPDSSSSLPLLIFSAVWPANVSLSVRQWSVPRCSARRSPA